MTPTDTPRPQDVAQMLQQLEAVKRPKWQPERYWRQFGLLVPQWSKEITYLMQQKIYDVPLQDVRRKVGGIAIQQYHACIVGEGNGGTGSYTTDSGKACKFCADLSNRLPYATLTRGYYRHTSFGGKNTYIPAVFEMAPAFVRHMKHHHARRAAEALA